jgi:signal transduction histidine kinase
LEKDKQRLEKIVQDRTAEVVKQKDEIQEKSNSLEKALDELHSAQNQLIRQEKMATVGKLTQGLIDRILNPLNYINNFSKLSEGLVKDIAANIEDEKDNMNEDNYEDTLDVLDMLKGNLQKVGEHGVNTTRTLKAMEEMLKDRSGGVVEMDLSTVLKQDEEMLSKYYAEEIAQYHIATPFNYPESGLLIRGNAEQLSKTFMSLIGNSIYAIVKKAQRKPYEAALSVDATMADGMVTIVIRDNGIGIEEKIIDKIFDPFFTTKTTGEASGIGLYLSHDVIQNYGGNITVESVKDEYTVFTITLPAITQ